MCQSSTSTEFREALTSADSKGYIHASHLLPTSVVADQID